MVFYDQNSEVSSVRNAGANSALKIPNQSYANYFDVSDNVKGFKKVSAYGIILYHSGIPTVYDLMNNDNRQFLRVSK